MMLRAQVHANNHYNPSDGSRYDYEMHAIVHPRATKWRAIMTTTEEATEGGDGTGNVNGILPNGYNDIVNRTVMLQNLGYLLTIWLVADSPMEKPR